MTPDIKDTFRKGVYEVVSSIPYGKVLTYGQVALLAGSPSHSRQVGKLLSQVDKTLCLPCHRVVNSQGRTVPHWPEQVGLLKKEGVVFRRNGCVDMKVCGWDFADCLQSDG